jgi:amidase
VNPMACRRSHVPFSRKQSRRQFLRGALTSGLALSFFGLRSRSTWATPPGSTDELCYWSAKKLAAAIRSKVVSAEEVVQVHLDRISRVNGKINAVVQLASERALAEARAADAALARGQIQGPLHGVPMTIKDSFDTEGVISTAGTKGRARFVPAQDATVVARLRAAGAILLGKTNTPEFCLAGVTDNLVYGRTDNPFDLMRTVGGSSGGPAAAMAAGETPVEIGSDAVSSLRWPAHCCGVASILPTSGRASLAGHILESGSPIGTLTQPGPIARQVEDLILILPIISGADPRDPAAKDEPLGQPAEVDLKILRVAFFTDNGVTTPEGEIIETVQAAAKALSGTVAKTEEESPAVLREAPGIASSIFALAGREFFQGLLQASGTPLTEAGPSVQYLVNNLPVLSAAEQANALANRDAFKQAILSFMENYDVILCAVNPRIAPLHSAAAASGDNSYTVPYNLSGCPAAVVRAGTSSQGLPIGVQIVGRPWEEHVVLAVAQFLETALGGWRPVPQPILRVQGSISSLNLSCWTVKGSGGLVEIEHLEKGAAFGNDFGG